MLDFAGRKAFEPRCARCAICALPLVGMKASGRLRASVSAWIFVVRPPRERPTA
jgi:hypothetical protein